LEYPVADEPWWYDTIKGFAIPIVKDGFIEVWDSPGLGVLLDADVAKPHLSEQDAGFFD